MNKDLLGIVITVLLDRLGVDEISIDQEDLDKIHNKRGEMFGLDIKTDTKNKKITVSIKSAFDAFVEQLLK